MATRDKTTAEIAEILSVDPSTISNWVQRGCPCDKAKTRKQSNKFDEAEVAAWMQANKVTGKMGRPAEPGNDELNALKLRKELALVLKYERENAIEDGKLLDASQEQQRDVAKVMAVRNRLCGLGSSLAPALVGLEAPEIHRILDEAVEDILMEFAK